MPGAEMILTFKKDGTVKKETKGFIGKECVTKTAFMEEALGTSKGRKFKDDYYKEDENRVRDKLHD